MVAVAADDEVPAGVIDLVGGACRLSCFRNGGPAQHISYREGARGLQLDVAGAEVLKPVHLLSDASLNPREAKRYARILTLP